MEMRREIEDLELGERKEHSNSSAAARQSMPKLSSPSYRAAIGYKLVASPVRGPNAPSRSVYYELYGPTQRRCMESLLVQSSISS